MNIKYGADEMILWLRKNGKAAKWGNLQLGREIHRIVVDVRHCNELLPENRDCDAYWGNTAQNIGDYNLPLTAAQYIIPIARMSDIFEDLNAISDAPSPP